jgi:hypothetical protein
MVPASYAAKTSLTTAIGGSLQSTCGKSGVPSRLYISEHTILRCGGLQWEPIGGAAVQQWLADIAMDAQLERNEQRRQP